MRLHLIISTDASGKVRSEYLGADRAEALRVYASAGKPGERVELFSFLQVTRRRSVPAAPEVPSEPVKKGK